MAAWMLYALATAAGLGIAGLLAERVLAVLGRPLRWLWLSVMLVSVLWPFVSAALLGTGALVSGGEAASTISPGSGQATAWRMIPAGVTGAVPDTLLVVGWCFASSLFLVVLLLSELTLRKDRRRCCSRTVAGERVLLSGRLGPAVVGAMWPRIVLPRWVLHLDEPLQRLIVLHEREHVRAGDGRLLVSALDQVNAGDRL
jgi:bla regulator protein blaR1